MPIDAAQRKELESAIADGRKKEMPFGVCLGKKPDATIWKSLKTKSPEANGLLAKKEGETAIVTYGLMNIKGKEMNLVVQGKMISGVAKKIKLFFGEANMKMKVNVLDADGNVLEAEGGEDESGEDGGGASSAETDEQQNPQRGKWVAVAAKVNDAIAKSETTPNIDLSEAKSLWAVAQKQADAGAYSAALANVPKIGELLKAAGQAVRDGANANAKQAQQWQAASAKLAPVVKQVVDGELGDTKKINAVWALAKAKASATPPNYVDALKAAGALAQLLTEARQAAAAKQQAKPEPAMAGDGEPPSSGEYVAPKNGASDGAEKIAQIEAMLVEIEKLSAKYSIPIPGSPEPTPPQWGPAIQGTKSLLRPMKADATKIDIARLDNTIKSLTGMQKIVKDATVRKEAWKSAFELFDIRIAPLNLHKKASAPEVKPTIDAIKADLAKAVAKATLHDHAGAIKDLQPLPARCAQAEILADDFAQWSTLDAPRKTLAMSYFGGNYEPASVDAQMRTMESTYNQSLADANAKRFKEAIAKLDFIPGQFEKITVDYAAADGYNGKIANHDPRIAVINGKDAAIRAPVQKSIDEFTTTYAAGKVAVTGDYKKSMNLISNLWRILDYLESEIKAIEVWNDALKSFDEQLNKFKTHKGVSAIQEVILEMDRDHAAAIAEANSNKHSTAKAVLNRSRKGWNPATNLANECVVYLAARKVAEDKINALNGRPEAEIVLKQAAALLDVAGTQALGKNYGAAKASADEAAKRADAAKDAADTQDEVGALYDTDKLDKIQKSWSNAHKVYTNMRSAVAKKDKAKIFDALLKAADTETDKGKAEHKKKAYDMARAFLDKAIGQIQQVLVLVLSHGPYEAHKAKVRGEIASLNPLNVDDTLRPKINEANARVMDAEALVRAPGYDFAGAENKLVEASKIVTQATADAAQFALIKIHKTVIESIRTAINADNAVKNAMPKRLAMFAKMLTDVDALAAAGKLGEAEQKARAGMTMKPSNLADIVTVKACHTNRTNWHDNRLPNITGAGKEAAANAYVKVQAKLATYTGYMTDEIFDAALNSLNEVSWAIDECEKAITGAATYAPLKAAADLKLNPLKVDPSDVIKAELQKIVANYDKALAEVARDNYFTAQKIMATIPEPCDNLAKINTAYKAYAPKQKIALDKLAEVKAHAQADGIAAMIERLQGKYDNAVKYATGGDYATAQKMMEEITPAVEDAIATADRHGLLAATNDLIAGDDDSAPRWPQILAAKASITLVSKRDHAEVAQAKIDEAFAKVAEAEKDGQEESVAKAALKAALEACNAADAIISQYQFHVIEIDEARTKLATLGKHAQKDFIATDIAELDAALDSVAAKARDGNDVAGISAQIETIMTKYHAAIALADGYVCYLKLRAEPEVEPRLTELEAHDHRYAIKPSIDTMRTKLQKAADEIGGRNIDAAIKLLEEARALGTSAFVTAQMTGNVKPTEADLKKILSRPGGAVELDAIVDKLPEEAQREVLKVAFKARYGCDIENFNNQNLAVPVADGSQKGPNIKAFYKAMEDLPLEHTLDNDSMQKFTVMDANGEGSFYQGTDKRIVMDEGNDATSGTRKLGSETEVEVTDDKCKPANEDPVNFFNWNTLHEVGHAVDDKQGYMDKNGTKDSHGGWTVYGSNVKPIAEKIKDKYDYDLAYITAYLAGNNSPAIPEKPDAEACSNEEWEGRRLAVRDHIKIARVGNNPWASMGIATKIAIGGVVYQESYENSWHSYSLSSRSQGITGYQFRAPGEWFSELYAAYHSGKLKPSHPAVTWLETL